MSDTSFSAGLAKRASELQAQLGDMQQREAAQAKQAAKQSARADTLSEQLAVETKQRVAVQAGQQATAHEVRPNAC